MRTIIFDAGPIISLTTNNLLWILKELNKSYEGRFYIPISVKRELIDNPLDTRKFKFEALQVLKSIREEILNIYDDDSVNRKAFELLELANHCFKGRDKWIKIVHMGEMEALAAAIITKADAIVVDERTTLSLLENPLQLTQLWKKKLRVNIKINHENLNKLKKEIKSIKTLRSVELVVRAYELGILNQYLPNKTKAVPQPTITLLSSLLWGLKIRGCSLRKEEINEILNMER